MARSIRIDDLCCLFYSVWLHSLFLFPLGTEIHPCITLSYLLNFLHHCISQVNFSLQKGKGFSFEHYEATVWWLKTIIQLLCFVIGRNKWHHWFSFPGIMFPLCDSTMSPLVITPLHLQHLPIWNSLELFVLSWCNRLTLMNSFHCLFLYFGQIVIFYISFFLK